MTTPASGQATHTTIDPVRVRYIKLGTGGNWEKECAERGVIRFGFGSASSERFSLCRAHNWDDLQAAFLAESPENKGRATRFTNETRLFFEDQGSTLWLTFVGERLLWGFLTGAAPKPHADGEGVWRSVAGGWKSTDINGEPLTKDRLSGALTKLAAYRGTSCRVDVDQYVIRRINGKKMPEVERAVVATEAVKRSTKELLTLLGPRDFETLVDLVFTSSGWRRLGVVGKTQKTLDLDIELPTTGERAFVQVKTRTTGAEFEEYLAKFEENDLFDRMFYVYHSGHVPDEIRDGVTVIGPDKLAEMVFNAGLVSWLLRKVS